MAVVFAKAAIVNVLLVGAVQTAHKSCLVQTIAARVVFAGLVSAFAPKVSEEQIALWPLHHDQPAAGTIALDVECALVRHVCASRALREQTAP